MARLDAHQHFWRYSPQTHGWIDDSMAVLKRDFLPPDLEPLLKRRGYDGCVAVQAEMTVAESHWLLDLADRHPFIRGVVGWVDLCSPDVADALAPLAKRPKLRGIRHIVQAEPDDFMRRPDFQRGIAALAPLGLTYDVLVYHRQLPAALDLVERFPGQKFVVDHVAKPDIKAGLRHPWAPHMRALARHPNVFCKVSGMVTEADWHAWIPAQLEYYLDVVFDAFGPERIMIGSDWPVCLLAADYDRTMSVVEEYVGRLPAKAGEAVLGETAARFYGI
ncbi:MAG TPA: amidohydrolase family protein [Polyangia bacterium]|nr:amidohydrolase family protein [Polyangia bacterium]